MIYFLYLLSRFGEGQIGHFMPLGRAMALNAPPPLDPLVVPVTCRPLTPTPTSVHRQVIAHTYERLFTEWWSQTRSRRGTPQRHSCLERLDGLDDPAPALGTCCAHVIEYWVTHRATVPRAAETWRQKLRHSSDAETMSEIPVEANLSKCLMLPRSGLYLDIEDYWISSQ